MDTIVETSGLAKTYGSGATAVAALQPTDLTILRGELVAVVGPSGSGKSTLLHLLGGLDRPSAGRVVVDGQDLGGLTERELAVFRRRRVGFVFQSYNLLPVLSAEENAALPLLLDGRRPEAGPLDELLSLLGLTERKGHLPGELSGGQQQRVAIARALVNRPALLLADEPTGNLDTRTGREVLALLRDTGRRFGQTIVMITHDPAMTRYADRVLEMVDGRVLGAPASPASAVTASAIGVAP